VLVPISLLWSTNAEKVSALWATTRKNTDELKLQQFSALLPTERKNDHVVGNNMGHSQRWGQQRRQMFGVAGPQCGRIAPTQNRLHFCESPSTFKGTVYLN
jgi:hypothetical protein